MKKSLIALAVAAGSIAAAQADQTTLYGDIAFTSEIADTVIVRDKDGNLIKDTGRAIDNVFGSVKDNHWNLNQKKARIGVKGNEDLGNGLQAIFKFEVENKDSVSGLNGSRDAYVGLKGDFGTVTIGRQGSTWNVDDDYFQSTSPLAEISTPSRESKAIKYTSPEFSGVTAEARIVADSSDEASFGVDKWDTSVAYEANGFSASAAYGVDYDGYMYVDNKGDVQVKSTGSAESMGVQAGYANDQFAVRGNVQHEASANTVYNVQGEYYFGGNNTVRAGLGYIDTRDSNVDAYSVGLGYQYNFSKRTSTWVEAAYYDLTKGDADGDFKASVGIRHKF